MALPLSLLLLAAAASAPISTVVVYPDRAQVVRVQSVRCPAVVPVEFPELPPAADPASLRARVDVGAVDGVSSRERLLDGPFSGELRAIEEQLRALEREGAAQRDAVSLGDSRLETANRYDELAASLISREMAAPRPDFKTWDTAFGAALGARLKAHAEKTAAESRMRRLAYQLADLRRKQDRLAAASQRRVLDASVGVSCPAGKTARVELSYVVGGASWEPVYEARADEAGGAVALATLATLTQSTGEDWRQARIVLSTATPFQDATPPELRPLRLASRRRQPERKVLVRLEEYREHAEESLAQAGGEGGRQAPASGSRLRAAAQGLSVRLSVPEPADVPGDGKPVRLLVATTRMPATFAFRTSPKLLPFVFRVADLTNTAAFALLPGSVDVFGKSGFIARYPLDRVAQGAPFHLTFGNEESLRVKRTVAHEVKRDERLFGMLVRFHYAYSFEVANHRATPTELELSEHVPVSELDDVKVELDKGTTGGFQLVPEDGIIRWKLALAPQQSRKLELTFHVDVPSSYDGGELR